MERIEKEITVNAPLGVVYDQWTQFEEFPQFMEGVKSVHQIDDQHLAWHAEILGQDIKWQAEIFEQIPKERIAWRSISGHPNTGAVYFTELAPEETRVTLVMEYQPMGAAEKMGDALGLLAMRVQGDLRRFKEFIEVRKSPTGGWRGVIREGASA
jgi:uncharacterized membrane protein